MQLQKPLIPKKYRPRGFEILHEDRDIIIVDKFPGKLSVAALWNKDETVHSDLNQYVKKGNPKASKVVYVVHRLDQATSGLMIFAKTEDVQQFLKNHWQKFKKTYLTIVEGDLKPEAGLIESYLQEDEDYHVHSSQNSGSGKLARTEYEVLSKTEKFSLVKINLLTGKKNQIRVHMSEKGNPVLGDTKYGAKNSKFKELMLHSYRLQFIHPFTKKEVTVESPVPERFYKNTGFSKIEFSK
jgi:tRNA pseudouridine32 synthase/23S rRNA pseudouridine746 synthase/23S rRNA pseudouridine1911/1915/1917 synthase